MKNLSSWLIAMFAALFWVFRIIVALYADSEGSFGGFIAFDTTMEIILLFITLVSILLIIKRKLIGGIIYLVTYGYYFGGYLVKNVLPVLMDGGTLDISLLQNAMVSIIAIILALCALLDIAFEKVKRNKYSDKKTDWFFDNKETDREKDERADKNQYKFY